MSSDIRPVFPEEQALIAHIIGKPAIFDDKSVWASDNRYYVDGKSFSVPVSRFSNCDATAIASKLQSLGIIPNTGTSDVIAFEKALIAYRDGIQYQKFHQHVQTFIAANQLRLSFIEDEAFSFVKQSAESFPRENLVVSFSGGKDSTVTADLVIRALSDPGILHIFGNTTLEFPLTIQYAARFHNEYPYTPFKNAINKDQNFYEVCKDIGPPARMMRWCCSMFKTGPITRILNNRFLQEKILTFYGIRKCESVSRSKYNRIEDNAESVKIQKQTVASPIFFWKDIDIWLYLLGRNVDFNDAYRLGYDRVGCWCCPNNNARAQFLSRIYMSEQSELWRQFLIDFSKSIGKPDAEVYVDSGKWKARQGGNGVASSKDVKITSTNCTAEENAKIYQLNQAVNDEFINMFIPFGLISKEMGRKLINETIILDKRSRMPILSIQPFSQADYEYAVKIKTLTVKDPDKLHRMVKYQIRKFNACRKCLKCESLCAHGAISITANSYRINPDKCKQCKMCVTAKYLDGGCLMNKYLKTKE
ncbi:phosphoadenosine phosphosulfate reductase family protein [Bengtsoniella intestinalis]|uniref:phosphoadenosine phosphosulfate reductase domain-containing protein n=1 Tax=Bengtsoniella intestinalis TaxID=3073143 RepID=UPI00391F5798